MAETLRVASVNVNGIRAAFRKGMGDWLDARDVDVLAMQEVRADDSHLDEHFGSVEDSGWHILHDPCNIKGRAGVAIASRNGSEYLRSIPDGKESNNLGDLPSTGLRGLS